MACAIGKAGDWERVLRLYADMQQSGVKPDVWTFSALTAACQACGNRWKDALKFLDQMESSGGSSDRLRSCRGFSSKVKFSTIKTFTHGPAHHEKLCMHAWHCLVQNLGRGDAVLA